MLLIVSGPIKRSRKTLSVDDISAASLTAAGIAPQKWKVEFFRHDYNPREFMLLREM